MPNPTTRLQFPGGKFVDVPGELSQDEVQAYLSKHPALGGFKVQEGAPSAPPAAAPDEPGGVGRGQGIWQPPGADHAAGLGRSGRDSRAHPAVVWPDPRGLPGIVEHFRLDIDRFALVAAGALGPGGGPEAVAAGAGLGLAAEWGGWPAVGVRGTCRRGRGLQWLPLPGGPLPFGGGV